MYSELVKRLEKKLANTRERENQLLEDADILTDMLRAKHQEIRICRQEQVRIKEDIAGYSVAEVGKDIIAS